MGGRLGTVLPLRTHGSLPAVVETLRSCFHRSFTPRLGCCVAGGAGTTTLALSAFSLAGLSKPGVAPRDLEARLHGGGGVT